MARISKARRTGNGRVAARAYVDETQDKVEFYHAHGYDAPSIAAKLFLSVELVQARLKQVVRDFENLTSELKTSDYVARERASLIKRSLLRQKDLQDYIDAVRQQSETTGKHQFPANAISALRDEDKWMAKMLGDIEKSHGKASVGGTSAGEEVHTPGLAELRGDLLPTSTKNGGASAPDFDDEDEETDEDEDPDFAFNEDLMEDLNTAVKDDLV